ncbi:MAG: hypothetical protein ACRDRK_23110 [Pseudonocardia sp.]
MSSETDHPRQRTVAELLAEHGDSGATSRRRRRRQADEPEEDVAPPEPSPGAPFAPVADQRAVSPRLPDPDASPGTAASDASGDGRRRGGEQQAVVPPRDATRPPIAGRQPERPTEVIPRIRGPRRPAPDEGLTGPMPRVPAGADSEDEQAGPATMNGAAAAGPNGWHGARTAESGRAAAPVDGGPPTQAAPLEVDDDPGPDPDDPDVADDLESEGDTGDADDADAEQAQGDRRPEAGASGHTWAAVVAQWIAGAIGGAALWVGFRFLWRELPVVAIAAAVLVTVGLVLIVRALLRNNDTRTTIFAVLVGLLLTVSPAILVLIGR